MISGILGLGLLLVPLAVTVAAIVALALLVRWHMLTNVYRELAKRFAGWLDRRWLLPVLRAPYRGMETRLYSTWSGTGRITNTTLVQIPWPDRRLRLLATHPALLQDLPVRRYGGPITGASRGAVASDLVVHGNDSGWAQRVLDAEVIDRLRMMLVHDIDRATWLTIERGQLRLHCAGALRERSSLERFLRVAWQLYDCLALSCPEGVAFLSGREGVAVKARCPVCTQPIEVAPAICAGCQTPHCPDCWDYHGGCAVFACGDKRRQ